MGYSGFLKTSRFSNYRKNKKGKKGERAGDVSRKAYVRTRLQAHEILLNDEKR
jgi:hypothetical protein